MRVRVSLIVSMLLLGACAPSSGPAPASDQPGQPSAPTRPLSLLIGREPASLSTKALGQAGSTVAAARRLFNATLTLIDADGAPHPYLAEALPRLDTDTWRVTPDGRMETTYPLRPNLTWHDGAPLTAEDFVFSWRMYAVPELGQTSSAPMNSIDEVAAVDPRTVLIRWKRPYPEAGTLVGNFPPVPRHILEPAFDQFQSGSMAADAFVRQPYWSHEFIGAGPYRLERWEPAVELYGVAFDGHVLGRPRINRVRVEFSTDQNASLARILAGGIDYASDSAIGGPQAQTLKKEWAPARGGSIFVKLDFFRAVYAQLKPEQASPAAITELRVRQALAHSLDKQALRDGLDDLFEQGYVMGESLFIPPDAPYHAQIDRAVAKYPFDQQRAAQLMADAGLTKGGDGYYQSPGEGRLRWEVKTSGSADNEREISILASTWRLAGFDFQQAVLPAALAQDAQARATFPTLYSYGTAVGENMLIGMNSAQIPRPDNRFSGSNRSGWSNPEFDGLAETLVRTLDQNQRTDLLAQMSALLSRDAVVMPLYFYGNPVSATSAIVGIGPVPQTTSFEWNIHEWTLSR